jgi:hypothetical protein
MRNKYFLFILLVSFSFACSGNVDANKPARAATANSTASNAVVASNTAPGVSSNIGTTNPDVNVPSAGVVEPSNKRPLADVPGGGRPVLRFEEAAEDSEIAQTMNSSGQMYEVRVWRKNPQLVKVESTWVDPKTKDLKIILRNGQVKHVSTDISIPNLKQATANQLLQLIGIEPSAAPMTPGKGAPKKAQ